MPPGGGGKGDHGCTVRDHPPPRVRRDEDTAIHSTPPLPAISPVVSQKRQRHEHEQQPVPSLPEGPLVEILARVPYRSLCRFRCVSKPWLALCSSRYILKRSPQTLSGFFYHDDRGTLNKFRNLYGRGPPLVDPSLPFLRVIYTHISVDQVYSGLLLCSCRKLCDMRHKTDYVSCDMQHKTNYVVCNPLTEEWTVLPPIDEEFDDDFNRAWEPYIGFDAAVPSRFVVFTPLTIGANDYGKVAIYSSETGQWSYVQSKWAPDKDLDDDKDRYVFLDGTMHWLSLDQVLLTVDWEGKLWREIEMPDLPPKYFDCISIGKSLGRLYAWRRFDILDPQHYIWVLEDYGTGKWTLKHTVKVLELLGRQHCHEAELCYGYLMLALHPDCNVIFLTDGDKMTVSYDLDNHKVDVICTESMYGVPYIPSFAELPSAGH